MLIPLMWQNSHLGNSQDYVMWLPENPKGTQNLCVKIHCKLSKSEGSLQCTGAVSDFMALFGVILFG